MYERLFWNVRTIARLSPTHQRMLVLALAFLCFYALAIALPFGEGYLRVQSNLIYNVPGFVALILVLRRVPASHRVERWGWLLMATMLLTWQAGDWIYSVYDLGLNREPPFPSIADAFYTVGYLALLGALPLLVYPRRLVANLRWVLDVLLIMTVVGSFYWVLIVQPILNQSDMGLWDTLLALSYPVWDYGLIAVIVGGVLAWQRNMTLQPMVLLSAMAVLAATDSLYSIGLLESGYKNVGNPLEVGWIAAYLLVGLAATTPPVNPATRLDRRLPFVWMIFPYLLALPLPIVEAVDAVKPEHIDVLSLGAAAVLLIAFASHVHASFMTTRAIEDERRKARIDGLTGALNHGAIIEEAAALLRATSESRWCLSLVDVDALKQINDAWGHRMGDQALKVIAGRLRHSGGIVGRYGGDEFLVLFDRNDGQPGESLEAVLLGALESAYVDSSDGGRVPVSASFGMAMYPEDADNLGSLIEMADKAMYAQKRRRDTGLAHSAEPVLPASPRAA